MTLRGSDIMELKHPKPHLLKHIIALQFAIVIFSLTGVFLKFSAGYDFLSLGYLVLCAVAVFFSGVYAIVWQLLLKKIPLQLAYSTRSTTTIWNLIWASLIFSETVTVKMLIGSVFIIIGVIIMVSDHE